MHNRDFEGPSLLWAVFSVTFGIVTAIALIWAIESYRDRLQQNKQFTSAITLSSPTAA